MAITIQELERVLEKEATTELFPGGYIPKGTILYHGSTEEDLVFHKGSLYFGLEPSISLWYILELQEKYRQEGAFLYMYVLTEDLPYVYTNRIQDHPSKNTLCERHICLHPQFAYHGSMLEEPFYNIAYELTVPNIQDVRNVLFAVSFDVSEIVEELANKVDARNEDTLTYIYSQVDELVTDALDAAYEEGTIVVYQEESAYKLKRFTIDINTVLDNQKSEYELMNEYEYSESESDSIESQPYLESIESQLSSYLASHPYSEISDVEGQLSSYLASRINLESEIDAIESQLNLPSESDDLSL